MSTFQGGSVFYSDSLLHALKERSEEFSEEDSTMQNLKFSSRKLAN